MFVASAPGTLMIAGEHAVLHNKKALVAALDKRIQATLVPRGDKQIILKSHLGELKMDLNDFCWAEHTLREGGVRQPHPVKDPSLYHAFRFVIEAIQISLKDKDIAEDKIMQDSLNGFDLNIHSEFSHTVGLGSSAAVTVATVSVLLQWLNRQLVKTDVVQEEFLTSVFLTSRAVIRRVQGYGSGADAAAAVYGGIILYQQSIPAINEGAASKNSLSTADAFLIKKLSKLIPIVCVYSGSKKSTSVVIDFVSKKQKEQPELFAALFNLIDESVLKSVLAIETEDWKSLGEIWRIQQGLMTAMSVSTIALDNIIHHLNAEPSIYAAKISGSGLGDCVIGLGSLSKEKVIDNQMCVSLSNQGLL